MAEECVSEERDLWKIPQDVAFDSVAALVDSYATVLIAARRANLCEEDEVLVTVAAGGLGLAAVDLASNLFKAKVIGACDTEEKASILREKGAFSTINYTKKEIAKIVMKETNNRGVKIVFDAVGGDVFEDCLQSIAAEGCIVVLGFSSRKIPQILTSQLLPKSCALIGVSLTHYQKMINETYRSTVQEVIDMYLEDFIDPHIAAHFKLKDVNDAIKHVEEGKSAGKVILDIV
ncbi:quinone oxidoreductase-like protein 2 homolog [Stegodyphus dumicola]|uniref:quinone oxidoreductase-like protein 2 homolog n=1 Tax=Stegodyphus dumicola TaxID=202533 RepID=UPI0015AC51A7|nr:quinone oxidoreductase-like protein 2 homolog [Stegodyphus dumicola]